MKRKKEWFLDLDYGISCGTVMSTVKKVFPQERDWTCSVACFRTLTYALYNKVKDEDYFVNNYNITIGPQNSKAISNWGFTASKDVIIYGCYNKFDKDVAGNLTSLLKTHNVMVECMLNYAHWLVVLGYIQLGDLEDDIIILYDPYYNTVRQLIADEFFAMWYDVDKNPIHRDYVAVRKEI